MPEREQDEHLDAELANLLPPVKPAREGDETRAARLLMELIGGKKLAPADERWLRATNVGFAWTDKGGSWNIPQVRLAALLWLDGKDDSDWWWVNYLARQLGEERPTQDEEVALAGEALDDPLFFFGGTEQFSNTYEGWRWGAVLAARLWALRHPERVASDRLLRLAARYSEVQTALLALGAAPGPTKVGEVMSLPENGGRLRKGERFVDGAVVSLVAVHTNASGQLWWQGPSLPMSGNRSTPAHVGTDERMPLYMYHARNIANVKLDRFGWPNRVLVYLSTAAGSEPVSVQARDDPASALDGIRLRTPHHFARWQEEGVRANWIERLGNKNTTSILGHVTYEQEQRAVYLYPFEGRRRKGLGEASCELVAPDPGTGGWRELVARSRFGEVRHELPERDPDSHVVVGPEGLQVLA